MNHEFCREILQELQKLLASEDIETFTGRPSESSVVRLVHSASDIEVVCDKYDTQIMNKVLALILLNQQILAKRTQEQ